jgi:hypothetical protein
MTESNAPTVNSTSPLNNANNSSCTDNITVTFIEDMDTISVTTNTDNGSCYGTIQVSKNNFVSCAQMSSGSPSSSSDNKTFEVKPAPKLTWSSTYKIRVTTGVNDPSGNPMSDNNTTGTGFTTASKGSGSSGC